MCHLRIVFPCLDTLSLLQGTGFPRMFTGSSPCPVLLAEVWLLTCHLGEGDGPPCPTECVVPAGARPGGWAQGIRAQVSPVLSGVAGLPGARAYNHSSRRRTFLLPGERGDRLRGVSPAVRTPPSPILVPPF